MNEAATKYLEAVPHELDVCLDCGDHHLDTEECG